MPSRKPRFRPTVQKLENRRCLTGSIAVFTFDSLDVTDPSGATDAGRDETPVIEQDGSDFIPDTRRLVVAIRGVDGNGNDGNVTDVLFSELGDDTTRDAGEHNYVSGGIYTITVTIIDDDTGQAVDPRDAVFSEHGGAESDASGD